MDSERMAQASEIPLRIGARTTMRSGAWSNCAWMTDYRAEWLGETLVERAAWFDQAPGQIWTTAGSDILTAQPCDTWVRFWLTAEGQVVDKLFDAKGAALGWYAPVTGAFVRTGNEIVTETLFLGLWIDVDNRITVMGEEEFDAAEAAGELTPIEIEQAEFSIRRLTTAVAASQFPPALVRNFLLASSVSAMSDVSGQDKIDTDVTRLANMMGAES